MSRKTKSGCIACVANCRDCDWEYESHKNGLALAAQHHDRTGHVVNIEITNYVTYGE